MQLKLYHYWRSSSSWRVRWALNLKDLEYELEHVNLLENEQKSEAHLARNPTGLVPCLRAKKDDTIHHFSESSAIIEWLEEHYHAPSLFPGDQSERALIRQLVQIINSGTQPLQNLQVMKFYSASPDERKKWAQHWIKIGLKAYETLVKDCAGNFSFGDSVTAADLFLIPQVYNANRFEIDLDVFPTIQKINDNALITDACQASHPDRYKP